MIPLNIWMEVEEKKIMLQNQTGFKKGLGTMNNLYVKLFN